MTSTTADLPTAPGWGEGFDATPPLPLSRKLLLIRVLVVVTLVLGVNYLIWRWLFSVAWEAWPIALPLVLAETYSLVDAALFGTTMWRLRERGPAPPPPEGATVDVFITTYNEPVDLVMAVARAAKQIRHPHSTWVLDDGARPEMRAACEAEDIGYLTRSEDWKDRPRHAKAGNLNNALFLTEGEFLLILDADQIPAPDIVDKTLGWFRDPRVALVQTPQYFTNVDDADPLGSQAPLFYGPLQQGKDGWNAAFFCGSNAVLRREALMQLGLVGYVREVERAVRDALRAADRVLAQAQKSPEAQGPAAGALAEVRRAVHDARRELDEGEPVSEVTYRFQQRVDAASRGLVAADLEALRADLAEIAAMEGDAALFEDDLELAGGRVVDDAALERLADREWSPLGALESVSALVRSVDVDRGDEAQPIMPLATISVTEDMATAMRLHGHGWKTVYHHEILAHGLAPDDLRTMLQQRLRWSQGTIQVLLRENPLTQRGMRWTQRLMYFATMWSYLSGFAALAYIAAPIIFLTLGILPVDSLGEDFFLRLIPFLIANQLLFLAVGWGVKTWRGQQYSLALFPIWIRAVTTAVGNVYLGQSLGFVVTPKTRETGRHRPPWELIKPQLWAMGLLVGAAVIGLVRWYVGQAPALGTFVNIAWVVYDLVVLSVIIQAARYAGPEPADEEAPV